MLCGNKDKHIVAFIAAQQVTVGRLKLLKKQKSLFLSWFKLLIWQRRIFSKKCC